MALVQRELLQYFGLAVRQDPNGRRKGEGRRLRGLHEVSRKDLEVNCANNPQPCIYTVVLKIY